MDGRSLSSWVSTVEWLGWQEEEGGTVLIWMPVISPGCCYELRLKGYPLVSARNTSQD
jgi:hypothetical protein